MSDDVTVLLDRWTAPLTMMSQGSPIYSSVRPAVAALYPARDATYLTWFCYINYNEPFARGGEVCLFAIAGQGGGLSAGEIFNTKHVGCRPPSVAPGQGRWDSDQLFSFENGSFTGRAAGIIVKTIEPAITWPIGQLQQESGYIGTSFQPTLQVFGPEVHALHQGLGEDGQLWHVMGQVELGGWGNDKPVAGATLAYAPAAVVYRGRMHVFYRGPGDDSHTYRSVCEHKDFGGYEWTTVQSRLAGAFKNFGSVECIAVGDSIAIFVQSANHTITLIQYRDTGSGGGTFSPPQTLVDVHGRAIRSVNAPFPVKYDDDGQVEPKLCLYGLAPDSSMPGVDAGQLFVTSCPFLAARLISDKPPRCRENRQP